MRWLVQGHTANKWQSWDLSQGYLRNQNLIHLLKKYDFAGTNNGKYFIREKKLKADYHQNFFFFGKCLI